MQQGRAGAMEKRVDVLIVGGGASGAAIAWSLAETKMHILCLEQGDWPKSEDFPANGMDWEARTAEDYALSPNRRQGPADYPINDDGSPIKIANYNGVGGGTVLYAGHFPRLLPSDFRTHSLDGVGVDWPIDYAALEPFYALNERMMGISSLAGDPAYPDKPSLMPPIPMGRTGTALAQGMNRLGYHWWPSDAAILTRTHEGRAPCINLGQCLSGCAQGAKASTDLTFWQAALRERVEIRTRARVSRVEVDDSGMATGAWYFNGDGVERFQPAEIVIMACNGVGTPRILLNSKSERHPQGLANSSGLVGRNLMLHPYGMVRGRVKTALDGHRGPPICLWSMEFYETDPERDFTRGYSFQFMRGAGPAKIAIEGMADGFIPWGEEHHERFGQWFGHRIGMVSICEDLPEASNRVTLDPKHRDANGIPAPKITYRLGENTRRMLDHSLARGEEILRACGATDIATQAPWSPAGWHLMGTARMGNDPKASVVNAWGRSHDIRNLFIVDGSVFPTSGGVNPTATIQAFALYAADQIKTRIHDLFD